MRRSMLAIPMEEVKAQFDANQRQDIKIVLARMLSNEEWWKLISKGRPVKPETPFHGQRWEHSGPIEPNLVCSSEEFYGGPITPDPDFGPFSISFCNDKAPQSEHYHARHAEIYYSESRIGASFHDIEESVDDLIDLHEGGLLVFAPGVVHRVWLSGITIVIQVPAVINDRYETSSRKRQHVISDVIDQ